MNSHVTAGADLGGVPCHSAAEKEEWVRVKTIARVLDTGLAKAYRFLEEVAPGAIKVCRLKPPGSTRGTIIVYLPSLLAYLDKLAEAQAEERKKVLGNE